MLQLAGLLVTEIEEAVARVVGVETQPSTVIAHRTLGPHPKGFITTAAKFIPETNVPGL